MRRLLQLLLREPLLADGRGDELAAAEVPEGEEAEAHRRHPRVVGDEEEGLVGLGRRGALEGEAVGHVEGRRHALGDGDHERTGSGRHVAVRVGAVVILAHEELELFLGGGPEPPDGRLLPIP